MTEFISSVENPLFKKVCLLQASGHIGQKARLSYGQAFLEGVHLIQTWLGDPALAVLLTSEEGLANSEVSKAISGHLDKCPKTRIYQLDSILWKKLSNLPNSPHFAGLIELPKLRKNLMLPSSDRLDGDVLLLDRIQDAGNVGSILRTAVAAGFSQVVSISGCAHLWSSKVLRAGMGAHRFLQLYEGWSHEQALRTISAPLLVTTVQGEFGLYELREKLQGPVAWVFGNEGSGVSEDLLKLGQHVSIPIGTQIESLNVSTAAAVCLFETARMRMANPK